MTRALFVACAALAALVGLGRAQDIRVQESGDPKHGREVARDICGPCHAIEKGASPMAAAPSFDTIAETPGMSQLALTVALRSAHRTEPALVLAPDEHNDVIAYILSLKGGT